MQKERYIFVAHCGADAQVAGKVTYYLRERGLRVWYESWDSYLTLNDERFGEEFLGTRFLIPVLSTSALAGEMAEEETWLSLRKKMAEEGILMVPVLCEPELAAGLPAALQDQKMIRMGISFEKDLNELILAAAMDGFVQEVKKKERLMVANPTLQGFIAECELDLAAEQWPADAAFRQVVISPVRTIKKRSVETLIPTIVNCPVKVSGWSGPSFPYPLPLGEPSISRPGGIAFADRHAWIGERLSFHYWHFNANGFFFQRQHLHEDQCMEMTDRYLSPDLLILWISQVLRFTQKLLAHLQECSEMRVELHLHGMKGRKLLWESAGDFYGEYSCAADDIMMYARLGMKTELVATAMEMAQYALGRFTLSRPPLEGLQRSVTMLCDGRYYKLEP